MTTGWLGSTGIIDAGDPPDAAGYYRVKMAAGEDVCSHCGAGKMWTIVYIEHGQTEETEIGQAFGDRELADDICDLMNMAFEAATEVAVAEGGGKQ